jgi:hypothetical protein
VIALRGEQVLERETGRLASLHSFAGLIRWRDALVEVNALRSGAYGCALGSMANELADSDDRAWPSSSAPGRNSSRPSCDGCGPTARSAPTPIPAGWPSA